MFLFHIQAHVSSHQLLRICFEVWVSAGDNTVEYFLFVVVLWEGMLGFRPIATYWLANSTLTLVIPEGKLTEVPAFIFALEHGVGRKTSTFR